jgi:hypothetical protein
MAATFAVRQSFGNEDTSDIPTPDGEPYSSMPEITVSIERVQKLLQKLNPQKACGPDQIPNTKYQQESLQML